MAAVKSVRGWHDGTLHSNRKTGAGARRRPSLEGAGHRRRSERQLLGHVVRHSDNGRLAACGYHLSNGQLGLVLGVLGLGVALRELPWGLLTDRWGDRRVLLIGLSRRPPGFSPWRCSSCRRASGGPTSAGCRRLFVTGLLGGSVNGSSGRAIMAWFRENERGFAMSIRQTAVPLGGGLGAALLPWLASRYRLCRGIRRCWRRCPLFPALFAWRWLHEPPTAGHALRRRGGRRRCATRGLAHRNRHRPAVRAAGRGAHFRNGVPARRRGLGNGGDQCEPGRVQVGAMVMRVWSGRYTDRHGNRRAYLRVSTWSACASFMALGAATALGAVASARTARRDVDSRGRVRVGVAWRRVHRTGDARGHRRAGTALGMANTAVYVGLFLTPLAIPHVLAVGSWPMVWLAAGVCASFAWPLFPKPAARLNWPSTTSLECGAHHDPDRPIRFPVRAARRYRVEAIRHGVRASSVVGIRRCRQVAPFNPLIRVPTVVLDSGDVLIESAMILDYLDEQAGAERAMIASGGPERRQALKVCALATGLADKAVALVYERVLHKEKSQTWLDRCTGQVERVLSALEADRAARATTYWFGDRSATRTSRWPARCASRVRRTRRLSRLRSGRRSSDMPTDAKRCRSSLRSSSRSIRRDKGLRRARAT